MNKVITTNLAYCFFLVAFPIGINSVFLSWLEGPLLYIPFVLASFVLSKRFGIKIAMLYLVFFGILIAYFFISPYSDFAAEKSDFYTLLGFWFLATIYLMFLDWSRQNFGDHH
jgi:integral membrane sensor domain MASE1